MSHTFEPDEPEGSTSRGSQYANRATVFKMLVGMTVLIVLMVPTYFKLKADGDRVRCSTNLKDIGGAIQLYMVDHDERMPPTHYPDRAGAPVILNELPLTWAFLVSDKMKDVRDFHCPSATDLSDTKVLGANNQPMALSYGMVTSMNLRRQSDIRSPETTILIAESMNYGALGSYNPQPFVRENGETLKNDGFLLGYDTGNAMDPETLRTATAITRLAFPKVINGDFENAAKARHSSGVQVIFANGSRGWISAREAVVERRSKRDENLIGIWSTR